MTACQPRAGGLLTALMVAILLGAWLGRRLRGNLIPSP